MILQEGQEKLTMVMMKDKKQCVKKRSENNVI